MMKKIIGIVYALIVSFSLHAKTLPVCGLGPNDDASLDWSKALDIKIEFALVKEDAHLCLGNTPGNPFDVKYVIYRDTTGLEKKFKLEDLESGTRTILSSDEIDFGVVKKGKIMTLQLQRESLGTDITDGLRYKASLRFLRNLAKIPFDSRDHRELKVQITQDETGDFFPIYQGVEFDEIKIKISAPSLVIKEIDLNQNGNTDKTIVTKKLSTVNEL